MSAPATYARAGYALGYAEQCPDRMPSWVQDECRAVMHAAEHADPLLLVEASIISGRLAGRRASLESQRDGLYGQHARNLRAVAAPVAAAVSATDLLNRARQADTPQDAHAEVLDELDRATRVSGQGQAWQQANHQAAAAAATLGVATASLSATHGRLPSPDDVHDALEHTDPGPAAALGDATTWQARQASAWATDLTRAARHPNATLADVNTALADPAGVVWWLQDDMHATWAAGFAVMSAQLGQAVNYMAMATACAMCLDNAAGSPYDPRDVPFIPAHGGCRCWQETVSWADAGVTSADQLS